MVMTDPDFSGIEWLDSLQGYLLTDFDFWNGKYSDKSDMSF